MGKEYKQADMWIVELNEDEWYSPGVDHDKIKLGARINARTEGCRLIAVFVTPDAIFPMCGHEKRHRVYAHDFNAEIESKVGFKVSCIMRADLDPDKYEGARGTEKRKMLSAARDALNAAANGTPGRYVIQYASHTKGVIVIEQGRV